MSDRNPQKAPGGDLLHVGPSFFCFLFRPVGRRENPTAIYSPHLKDFPQMTPPTWFPGVSAGLIDSPSPLRTSAPLHGND